MAKDLTKKETAKGADIDLGFGEQEMMMVVMVVMMVVIMQQIFSPVAQAAQRTFAAQSFQGDIETKVLPVTDSLQYWDLIGQDPYIPLISVFLINRGENRVYVAINSAIDWMEIWPGETRTISHVGAAKRIEIIFYRCDPGNTSLIEAEGHF